MKVKKNKPPKTTLKTYFFTGIIVTAPVAITLYLAFELISYADRLVTGFIPANYNPNNFLPYGIPGIGVVLLLVFFTVVGMLTANFMGQALIKLGYRIINRMPFISGVYNAIRKIFETILGPDKNKAFRQAVLVEYPRRDLWTIAFLTGPVPTQIKQKIKDKTLISIYVPTTPNPTSGFFLYVPAKDIILLDIPVEEALKMILSTGIINPTEKQKKSRKRNLSSSKETPLPPSI